MQCFENISHADLQLMHRSDSCYMNMSGPPHVYACVNTVHAYCNPLLSLLNLRVLAQGNGVCELQIGGIVREP